MHCRLKHCNVAGLRERQPQFWVKSHDLAPFTSPGVSVPDLERYVLVEAISVADDERWWSPCVRHQDR